LGASVNHHQERAMAAKRILSQLTLAVGLAFMASGLASAATVTLRTGVDNGGNVMAAGSADGRWQISVDGKLTWTDSKVAFPAQICCNMSTVAGTAAWVTDPSVRDGSNATSWGVNRDVWLKTEFDLSAFDLNSVAMAATWRIADYTLGIYLNGNLISGTDLGFGVPTWDADRSFTLPLSSGLFNAGLNTLEMRGRSVNSVWDAFWFDGTVRGDLRDTGGQVPVPATLGLALLGLGLVAAARRRA
jgi:MYXO-CTERM domain-containing protein